MIRRLKSEKWGIASTKGIADTLIYMYAIESKVLAREFIPV
jgi:hypothetical protein